MPALLAFDSSTDRLSVALELDGRVWQQRLPGGAHASAALLPAVRALLAEAGVALAALDAIAFGRGPGSFTGLRTACAVAQGLAFGARLPVLPVDTLLATAEDARARHGVQRVVAVLDARMDEVYWAHWEYVACTGLPQPAQGRPDGAAHGKRVEGVGREGTALSGMQGVAPSGWRPGSAGPADGLCAPEAVPVPAGWALAGTAAAAYGDRLARSAPGAAAAPRLAALPEAAAMLRLATALLAAGAAVDAAGALPRYVRDRVAQTSAERDAARQAAARAGQR